MAIIINIRIKLLPREYVVTINSAEVNRKIKAGLTRTRMSIESSLNTIPVIGTSLKNMFITMLKHLPTVNVTVFKFNQEYVILVNTDKKLAPYVSDVKTLISTYSEKVEGLRSIIVLPAYEIEENPEAELKIILIPEKDEYSEKTEISSTGRPVKIVIAGKNRVKAVFPNLNPDTLLSKGLVLYGDEYLKGWVSEKNEPQEQFHN
ncbi:MAG: hypothetical protein QXW09_07960 [Thermoproteota archaeon]